MLYMVTFTINIPQMLAYIYIYHTWILCIWPRIQEIERERGGVEGADKLSLHWNKAWGRTRKGLK
jgi:hypothetical protein